METTRHTLAFGDSSSLEEIGDRQVDPVVAPSCYPLPTGRRLAKKARPFLKWAGGKSRLIAEIVEFVPQDYERYVEPFLGGGATFFALAPKSAFLSDSNPELMNCYGIVRDHPDELLQLLKAMPVSKAKFNQTRTLDPLTLGPTERAARFIYLNKLCYNGLYRVNKKGRFNTPYGNYRDVKLADEEVVYAASDALQSAELVTADFEDNLLKHARPEDFIYLDPPYPPVGVYSDFKRYTREFFDTKDHVRLAKVIYELDRRCCRFVLSNAEHPLILELYSKFKIKYVQAPRFVNCKRDRRGNVSELLVTNL